jgi:hypothetical protein
MQGVSLVERLATQLGENSGFSPEEETIIRERLSGLGYIS